MTSPDLARPVLRVGPGDRPPRVGPTHHPNLLVEPMMSSHSNPDVPTAAEIAALTARLGELSSAGAAADDADRARFLADKDALIARITDAARHADPPPRSREDAWAAAAAEDALTELVRARAEEGRYALVGPSGRTWRTDPDGRPVEPGRRGRAQGPAPAHGPQGVHGHRTHMARQRDRQHGHSRRPGRRARPDRRRGTIDRRRT